MVWRRVLGLLIVFAVGSAAGALLLRASTSPAVTSTEAQRRAIAVLDRAPVQSSIGDNHIVSAVKRIAPVVVNMDTMGRIHGDETGGPSFYAEQEVHGKGSGVIVTPDGYIVTNNHVIDGASRIRVTLSDGRWYYARLIGRDPQTDLAVVRIEATNLPCAEMADSDRLQVGEWSIAVGNPLGLGSTITVGVVSALNRHNLQVDEGHHLDGAIQTDAAINRGNSGGALANINGDLVGINTAILSSGPGGGSIGLGFAIPANTVRRVVRQIIADGKTTPVRTRSPWLGIAFEPLPEGMGPSLGLAEDRGALIRRVLPESPASLAGLADGDIVLRIDGKEIGEVRDVREAIMQRRIGERCLVHVLRPDERREHDIRVRVAERPAALPVP